MSILVRTAPGPTQRRDITGLPWQTGQTVPGPLQESMGGGKARYAAMEAFEISAVTACVGLRAGAFGQIPLRGYIDAAQSPDSSGPARLVSPQPEILAQPSPVVVRSVWKIQMSISRDLWGYAIGKILAVDGAGYPAQAEWIQPDLLHSWQDHVSGPLRWSINRQEIDSSLLLHIPSRWVTPGNPLGMSPLEHSGLVDLAKRAQMFGRDWFRNGAVPAAIIYSEEELTEKESDNIVNKVMMKWRSRRPAVMDSRLKYQPVSVTANESQFLETKRAVAAEIAISFNLPPHKLNASAGGSSLTYENQEQSQQQILIDSINPDMVVIEETLDRYCLPPAQHCRFYTDAFLRSNRKDRYQAHGLALRDGWMNPNEVRASEDMSAIPNGEIYLWPMLPRRSDTGEHAPSDTNPEKPGVQQP